MEIRYTVKIKDEHNPPEFKKGYGKGVLVTQDVEYKTIQTEEDLKSIQFQRHVFEFSKDLLEKWFDVKIEIIDIKKERKKKLKQIEENEKEG